MTVFQPAARDGADDPARTSQTGRYLGLASGLALSLPFLLDILPAKFAFLACLPLLALVLLKGPGTFALRRPDWILWPLLAVSLAYGLGLDTSDAGFRQHARELVVASSLIAVYLAARWTNADPASTARGFIAATSILAVSLAVLSLAKMYIQERGTLLTPLTSCSLGYPGGTNLCTDYNLFGLMFLLGIAGVTLRFARTGAWAGLVLCLPLLLAAGQYLGSRRFLLLFPVLLLALTLVYLYQHRHAWKMALLRLALAGLAVFFGTLQLMRFVAAPDIAIDYTNGVKPFRICALDLDLPACAQAPAAEADIGPGGDGPSTLAPPPVAPPAAPGPGASASPPASPPAPVPAPTPEAIPEAQAAESLQLEDAAELFYDPSSVVITATRSAILNHMKTDAAFGMSSRFDRWAYALTLMDPAVALHGMGFDYRKRYGCRFLDCQQDDYPHLPLASAALYGGIGFGLIVALYYAAYGLLILRAGYQGVIRGASIVAMLALPYVLISGDTLLSLPHVVGMGLLMALSLSPAARARSAYEHAKRLFDVSVSLTLLILLSPVMLAVALASRWFLGPGVLFIQERPGLHGRLFAMVKFRTMLDKRNSVDPNAPDADRLTRYGKFLRSTSLDELPELWNVLKGDMSLVGPRPLLVEYLPLYSAEQARRHEVRPGVTGWAQVNGRNAIDWETKLALDVWYVERRSFLLDLRILWMTIAKVIGRRDITSATSATTEKFTGQNKP